jgi:hypothetical protein
MNLCRSSRPRKLAVLKALPLDLITVHFQNEQVPDALGDQATGLFQHLRMAFLLNSRDALHGVLRN